MIPATCAHRPTIGGTVIPWANVRLADGGVDFRSHHHAKWLRCWTERLCQVCGGPLKHPIVMLGGPRQLRELLFDEPPLHPECAVYTSRACPMVAGERTHFATRDNLAAGRRGERCPDPDCDCAGWVTHPGTGLGKGGYPAVPYFAVYVRGFALAAVVGGSVTGGICTPADVLGVRRVSEPGRGRIWRREPDALADYSPPATCTDGAAR